MLLLVLSTCCVDQLAGAAGSTSTTGDKESEDRTRSALIAWLGSQYVGHNEIEARLAGLARDVSDDLSSKVDKAAALAAAAAGLCWLIAWLI